MVNYVYDEVSGLSRPTLYPGEDSTHWEIPEGISADYNRLNAIIETKYSREFLKVCAFYNKMFPSLKVSEWTQSTYNTIPFTASDQERSDTGTGMSSNYLKQIIDQVTSRIGTITFTPALISEEQSLEYVVYKDEVERVLRTLIQDDNLNGLNTNIFHDGAILGYSHVFIDPYTGKLTKANDFEVGMFESQFNKDHVVQMLYRDYSFPTSDALIYLEDCEDKDKAEILEDLESKSSVDLKMYFNCLEHKVYVTINNKTLPPREYPFNEVLMATFKWDTGITNVTTTSLFDLLYPCQREINKINAKIQQLNRMYKGPVPVFSADVDIGMKNINNSTGECLYVDTPRDVNSLMTVINPTPLDPELPAQITEYRTAMYELAGLQNMSLDMENMRSAAAVVALDQIRDAVYQAQLQAMAKFTKDELKLYIKFYAYSPQNVSDRKPIDWVAVDKLVSQSYIELTPTHINEMLSDEKTARNDDVDYIQLVTARLTLEIVKGEVTWETLPYYVDPDQIVSIIAVTMVKFEALGIEIPDTIHIFLINAFIDAIARGLVEL